MLTILAGVAEFEREIIRERTLAGVRAPRAAGKTLGRPRRVFRRDEVIRMRAEGQSWRAIAAALNLPVSTVRGVTACEGSTGFEVQFPNVPEFYAGRSSLLRCLESA